MTTETYKHEYPLEGDDEVERLQNQHHVIKDAMGGKLIMAPVDLSASSLRILDSGTSDGTWIQDVAATSPATVKHEIVGTDINLEIFPQDPPAGTTYQIQDINEPWPEEWKGTFDLVHQRLVVAGGGSKQREAIQALAALVKPGGWIQLIEATNKFPDSNGPAMKDLVVTMHAMMTFLGANLQVADKMGDWLEEAGFVDVQSCVIQTKLGATNPDATLAKRGVFSTATVAQSLATFGKSLPPGTLSLSPERLDALSSDVREELIARGAIFPMRVVWARKSN